MAELGERIRELRRQRQLTLQEVSRRTGLSTSHLSEVERSKAQLGVDKIGLIARALEVPVSTLIPDVDNLDDRSLPPGLADLLEDPIYGVEIDEDWLRLLTSISLRGYRPNAKRDWLGLYLVMRPYLVRGRP